LPHFSFVFTFFYNRRKRPKNLHSILSCKQVFFIHPSPSHYGSHHAFKRSGIFQSVKLNHPRRYTTTTAYKICLFTFIPVCLLQTIGIQNRSYTTTTTTTTTSRWIKSNHTSRKLMSSLLNIHLLLSMVRRYSFLKSFAPNFCELFATTSCWGRRIMVWSCCRQVKNDRVICGFGFNHNKSILLVLLCCCYQNHDGLPHASRYCHRSIEAGSYCSYCHSCLP
jgi:hypothetical protein